MDSYRFSKKIERFEGGVTFHFSWNLDRYEAYAIMYNELFCFNMVQTSGGWDIEDQSEVPVLICGIKHMLAAFCDEHYQQMKSLLKK